MSRKLKRRAFLRYAAGALSSAVVVTGAAACSGAHSAKKMAKPVPAATKPKEHIVEIKSFAFSPAALSVNPGDTITWINRDIAPHTATAADDSWNTGSIAKDERKSIVVKAGMVTDYYCQFHPMMKAKLAIR